MFEMTQIESCCCRDCKNGEAAVVSRGRGARMRKIAVLLGIVGSILCGSFLTQAPRAHAITVDCTARGEDVILRGCDFSNTILSSNFTGGDFLGTNFNNATLTSVNFTDANLRNSILIDANLENATLTGANLTGADLYGANLTRVWSGSIQGTVFRLPIGWQLTNTYLIGPTAILAHASLSGINLNEVDLSGANLYAANLIGTNLSGANLTSVNLTDGQVSGANLSGAILTSAILEGTNLSGFLQTETHDRVSLAPFLRLPARDGSRPMGNAGVHGD